MPRTDRVTYQTLKMLLSRAGTSREHSCSAGRASCPKAGHRGRGREAEPKKKLRVRQTLRGPSEHTGQKGLGTDQLVSESVSPRADPLTAPPAPRCGCKLFCDLPPTGGTGPEEATEESDPQGLLQVCLPQASMGASQTHSLNWVWGAGADLGMGWGEGLPTSQVATRGCQREPAVSGAPVPCKVGRHQTVLLKQRQTYYGLYCKF